MQDLWHSVAANAVGVGFALACGGRLFLSMKTRPDPMAAAGLVISVIVPLAMVALPDVAGLLQRGMFLFSAAYLVHRLRP